MNKKIHVGDTVSDKDTYGGYTAHETDKETEAILKEFSEGLYKSARETNKTETDSTEIGSVLTAVAEKKEQQKRAAEAGKKSAKVSFETKKSSKRADNRRGSEGINSSVKDKSNKTEKKKISIGMIARRLAISIFAPILCICIVLLSADAVICFGPSDSVRGLFVTTVMETSAAKFLAQIFLSDEEIAQIRAENSFVETDAVTDTNMVTIDPNRDDSEADITVEDVSGGTFKGKMMIVKDPSRLKVATLSQYGENVRGKKVLEFIKSYKAVAGINAGGFVDTNGTGSGGLPMGLIITDGKLRFGSKSGSYSIVGFDKDNKLVVGRMTGAKALELNVRDAVSFGPALIINGERAEITGNGSGLNPRTCVGQRADGTVLLLVIDGRHPDSIGASLEDCVDVMEEFGAVNAGNLDGGSSTVMYWNGEMLNNCASMYGPRRMCSAFVVI